jgi:mannose-6-phosphate isomerase-like protein (cupin superfamily)
MTEQELAASGLLEQLVLGTLTAEQAAMVRTALASMPALRAEVEAMEAGLEHMAMSRSVPPPASARAGLMRQVALDVAVRQNEDRPPILHPRSKVSDYARWIDRPEMVEDPANENIFFIPFAANDDGMSALVWMRKGADEETHTDCIEKFLIIEGTCDIFFNGRAHPLKAGDHMSIPMHVPHSVKVTSEIPCRIIIQRIAA